MTRGTNSQNSPYIILNNQGEILPPIDLINERHILGRDPQKADLLVPEQWGVVGRIQACFRKVGNDYYIYDGDGNRPSTNRLSIDRSTISTKEGYCLQNGTEIKIGQNPSNWVILTYRDPNSPLVVSQTKIRSISLKNRSIMLGRDPSANLVLDAPTVSRKHAVIDTDSQGRYILQNYSPNGVFVNGQKVNDRAIIVSGSTIHIGPYILVLQGDELVLADRGNNIRLDADNLVRVVKDKRGQNVTLINNISLPIEPGQLVALVGGSGAGKSTLMRTLLGIEITTNGVVYLNGENLRKNFNIYRSQIGYVPQNDIVHKDLRVGEVLTYAAKLRLLPDIDLEEVVTKTLQQIEMLERRDVLVKNLSGGQLKRVSIGVELLADPKLFFLDEPTSGLDPGLDKKMMELLRKLADEGRTVILVTHATSNITLCDRIVFLGLGGNLCYFGSPQEAIDFFKIPSNNFADIYIKLESKETVFQEAEKFKQSNYYKQYIDNRLNINNHNTSGLHPEQVKLSTLQQLSILTQRYFKLTLRDPVNLGLALLTAPIGISLINLAIQDKEPLVLADRPDYNLAPLALRVLFIFTCSGIWVGLSSSLQEIVKESEIYLRERLVNLSLLAYLGSKVFILAILALVQACLITFFILGGFASPQSELIPWYLGVIITTFLTVFASVSLGLTISTCVKNSSQANNTFPLLLIPQVIFSGVLFKMEGISKCISWLMLSRWSVGAYGVLIDVNAMAPEPIQLPDGSWLPQAFEPTSVYDPNFDNLALNWGILLLHTAVYLSVTLYLQKRKDIL